MLRGVREGVLWLCLPWRVLSQHCKVETGEVQGKGSSSCGEYLPLGMAERQTQHCFLTEGTEMREHERGPLEWYSASRAFLKLKSLNNIYVLSD